MQNLDRLTMQAQEVLNMATHEASRLRHAEVTPEHLALALFAHQRSASLSIAKDLGANISQMQQDLRNAATMAQTGDGFGRRLQRAVDLAVDESRVFGAAKAGTEHLLAGVIREGRGAKEVLASHGISLYGVHKLIRIPPHRDGEAVPKVDVRRSAMRSGAMRMILGIPVSPSPIFLGLIGLTVLFSVPLFLNAPLTKLWAILFVISGWLIALCLHEFGHAAVAFLGGDSTVVSKGYLTLNPLKYTHPILSIAIPTIMLLIGGIPLPGGAVYIDRSLIRDRRMRSLMSAAGVIADFIFVLVLLIPYLVLSHLDLAGLGATFWAVYAFFLFLNIFVIVINLLPIPGIDGFGILEPFLPLTWVEWVRPAYQFGPFVLFIVLVTPNPISFAVGWLTRIIASLLGIDMLQAGLGGGYFRLW